MSSTDTFRLALGVFKTGRLRSLLTILGIVVGVASVVTMVAVGKGAQTLVSEQIRTLGANVLMIVPGAAKERGVNERSGSGHTLTESDARSIEAVVPEVALAAPAVYGSAQLVVGNRNWNTDVSGTTSDYFGVRDWPLATGRYFSAREEANAGKVALIGRTVARQLFGEDVDPVGASIRIGIVPFRVVGLLSTKGTSGFGRDQDDIVFVPLSSAKLRVLGSAHASNREAVAYILVKTVSDDAIAAAKVGIEKHLRRRHRLVADEDSDFEITDPAAAMSARLQSTKTISWLLAAVSGVSLLVGGIGIMNIMLVSVRERTREIGLRLAVGAAPGDIRNQFLFEAVVLCLAGGAAGILTGVAGAALLAEIAGWPAVVAIDAIAVALLFSVTVGIFFGYYPARRAANLDPVICLATV